MSDTTLPPNGKDDLYKQVKLLLEQEKELSATKLRLEHIIARNLSLQQISQFLITNQVMDEGLRYATRALVVEMSFEKSFLVLRTNGVLSVATSCGYPEAKQQELTALPASALDNMFEVIKTANKGEYVDTPEQRARFEPTLLDTIDLLTFLSAPLREGDEITGFLIAGYSKEQEISYRENLLLSEQDSLWFSALANQMSAMIVNAKLITSLQERTNKLHLLSEELAKANQDLEKKVQERTDQLKQNVDELLRAKAKDEAIFAGMGEGLIVTDTAGVILLMNGIVEDMFELGHGTSIGRHLLGLLRLGDEQGNPTQDNDFSIAQALHQGQKTTQTFSFIKNDGKKIFVDITVTPVIQKAANDSVSQIIGAIAIVRDITKEKEVDRMKTEFISLASHQLRTPLSAIKWFSEMLITGDAGKLSPEQEEFAHNIADSTQRMIELVNSLLNISRMESGRIIIDPKPTDLQQLVSGIINDLKGKTEEKKQSLAISVHKDLPLINIDPHMIGQVYLNLLTNAIKYTPEGGDISVIISRKDNQVISQVSDTGYGIPKDEQSKMFQKFFRAANVAQVVTDGTGLGMYLVKAIIETSGGKIWFESEEGKGSTFWFSLPLSGMKARAGEVTLNN
ncbi:MAG TPA: ATP-binding protein [Candidatus Saccharimonadales bacterium]|nr:ATP-binding protein [Candidatus Saccharimonadales bacterium]